MLLKGSLRTDMVHCIALQVFSPNLFIVFAARCWSNQTHWMSLQFLAQDVICTSRAYATMSVPVCDVCALWSQGAMDPGYLCMLG